MKVLPFKIPKPEQDTLIYQEDFETSFYDKLHQHEEIQFSIILEGEGTLIVGDTVNFYSKNDILILDSNMPHVFKSDVKASEHSRMLSLFFTKDSFGTDFFDLEELLELQKFFKRSKHGFKVTSHKKILKELFLKLEASSKLERFMILLQLMKIASQANYESLSSFIYDKKYSDNEGKRMRDVLAFTMNQYTTDITLDAVAEVSNMTKNAFCKYFKKRTNKTYFQFLNELRIENACKLIQTQTDSSISEIAYQSGFNNISNFNRQFKIIKGKSPNNYRKNPNS
ncbi:MULTISPECIES: AraC family transcriptional regulator [Bizionia]|uniref:AraC family transcriptional regulator n=1 Tax=Bizionia algoritergicola TaxID=291187 RepID=A0A5D0QZQ3_9FLAO|nr:MULTISPECIES: AraC family transcriptional regulator [Bizionia]OBX23070.1 cupin [Bizionia sp. APA-3]TYB74730.1 AraC family transcriptional regulator [Bizionia algoritergicola]